MSDGSSEAVATEPTAEEALTADAKLAIEDLRGDDPVGTEASDPPTTKDTEAKPKTSTREPEGGTPADPGDAEGKKASGPDLSKLPPEDREVVKDMPPEVQQRYLEVHKNLLSHNNAKSEKLSDKLKEADKLIEMGKTFEVLAQSDSTKEYIAKALVELKQDPDSGVEAGPERVTASVFEGLMDQDAGGGLEENLFAAVVKIATQVASDSIGKAREDAQAPRKLAVEIKSAAKAKLSEMDVALDSEEAGRAWDLVRSEYADRLTPENVGDMMSLALKAVRAAGPAAPSEKTPATTTPAPAKERRPAKVRTIDARVARTDVSQSKAAAAAKSNGEAMEVDTFLDMLKLSGDLTEEDLNGALAGFLT